MINDSGSSGEGLDPTGGAGASGGRPGASGSTGSGGGPSGSPNAGAGTPQRGDSSPQLSSSTQNKMRNAGMNPSGSSGQDEPVTREEFDELMEQNQQIIDLLEDVVNQIKSQNGRR